MPTSCRIGIFLELLSNYNFNLYYVKGKDLILSDFLSRIVVDDSNHQENISISFDVKDNCRNFNINILKKYKFKLEIVLNKKE